MSMMIRTMKRRMVRILQKRPCPPRVRFRWMAQRQFSGAYPQRQPRPGTNAGVEECGCHRLRRGRLMLAWRIAKRAYALDRIGTGSRIAGGRWNSEGVPAIYAGLTAEIAAMEKLVHAGRFIPADLVIVKTALPDDPALYETPDPVDLPAGWAGLPSSPAAAAYGDRQGFCFRPAPEALNTASAGEESGLWSSHAYSSGASVPSLSNRVISAAGFGLLNR